MASLLDWLVPVVACTAVWLVARYRSSSNSTNTV
jgi:hypothetical protein